MSSVRSLIVAAFSLAMLAGGSLGPSPAMAVTIDEAKALLPADIKEKGVVRIGSQQNNAPYEFRKSDGGELVGLSVDLLAEALSRLGLKSEWLRAEFAALIPGITAGRFDFTSGGMSDTQERQQAADFVNYVRTGLATLVRAEERDQYSKPEDLCGKQISHTLGAISIAQYLQITSDRCVQNGKEKITVTTMQSAPDVIAQLELKRTDAFVNDFGAVAYVNQVNPGKYALMGEDYIAGTYLLSWGFGKQNTGLRDALQAAVQTMVDDGKYIEILNRWGLGAGALSEITVNAGPSSATEF